MTKKSQYNNNKTAPVICLLFILGVLIGCLYIDTHYKITDKYKPIILCSQDPNYYDISIYCKTYYTNK